MARPDPERVWLGFAQAALGGAMSVTVEIDPTSTTWAATNKTICDDVAEMADLMLAQWKLRYCDEEPAPPTTRGVQPSDVKLPEPTATAVDW